MRKLDDHLRDNEWLVPGMYTLADICNFAIANGMQYGFAEFVNKDDTPGLLRWIEQINERPAAQKMFAEVPSARSSHENEGAERLVRSSRLSRRSVAPAGPKPARS